MLLFFVCVFFYFIKKVYLVKTFDDLVMLGDDVKNNKHHLSQFVFNLQPTR